MPGSIGTMSGCLLNIILDPIFILPWGLNMGAAGAGLALFSQTVWPAAISSCCCMCAEKVPWYVFLRRNSVFRRKLYWGYAA